MGGGRPAPGRGRGGGRGGGRTGNLYGAAAAGRGGGGYQIDKAALEAEACKLEEDLGYENFTEGDDRLGWLMNMSAVRSRSIVASTRSLLRPHRSPPLICPFATTPLISRLIGLTRPHPAVV